MMIILLILITLTSTAHAYDYVPWDVEPILDFSAPPGLSRTIFFIHNRKAAGTAFRQLFRAAYHKLQCLPPTERKFVHSDQDNWRCRHLAFYHVEWHCFVGSRIARLRRNAAKMVGGGALRRDPVAVTAPLTEPMFGDVVALNDVADDYAT